MKPTAIFIDIDSTLCTHKNNMIVSEENIRALKNAQKQGIYVVLATGRDNTTATPIHKQIYHNEFGKWMIHSNGSVLEDMKESKKVFEKTLDEEISKNIINFAKVNNYGLKFAQDQYFYLGKMNFGFIMGKLFYKNKWKKYSDINFEKISFRKIGILPGLSKKKTKKVDQQIKEKYPNVEVARTGSGYYIEITNKGITKAFGATELSKIMDWNLENCVAIGDSMNDYPLFKVVGYPIAMKNSLPELFEIAKYTTDSDKNDGVAKAIKSLEKIPN